MTSQHDELILTLLELFYHERKPSLLGERCFKYTNILLGACFVENKCNLLGLFLLADKSNVLGVLYLQTEVFELYSDNSHLEKLQLNTKIPQVRVSLQIFELHGHT
jgi:hypothetical protein